MVYSKALVVFFLANIGTIWTPGSSIRGLAFARPSFFDDISSPQFLDKIVGSIAQVRSKIHTPGLNFWFAENGYLWLEKQFNIPTHYGEKLEEIERRNKMSYNYVINADNIYGSINIQNGNTVYPVTSGGTLTFGPTTLQKGNSYGIQDDTGSISVTSRHLPHQQIVP